MAPATATLQRSKVKGGAAPEGRTDADYHVAARRAVLRDSPGRTTANDPHPAVARLISAGVECEVTAGRLDFDMLRSYAVGRWRSVSPVALGDLWNLGSRA